jgi:hypothetical protein
MRERLHCKRQIALLNNVHNIRLIRDRSTPQPTAAPSEDEVVAEKDAPEAVSLKF